MRCGGAITDMPGVVTGRMVSVVRGAARRNSSGGRGVRSAPLDYGILAGRLHLHVGGGGMTCHVSCACPRRPRPCSPRLAETRAGPCCSLCYLYSSSFSDGVTFEDERAEPPTAEKQEARSKLCSHRPGIAMTPGIRPSPVPKFPCVGRSQVLRRGCVPFQELSCKSHNGTAHD